MRKSMVVVFGAAGAIAIAGCVDELVVPQGGVAFSARAPRFSISVSIDADTLTVGDSARAAAVVRDRRGDVVTGRTITWRSDDTLVATVSSAGMINARRAGQTIIQASTGDAVDRVPLTVIDAVPTDTVPTPTDTVPIPTDTILVPTDTVLVITAISPSSGPTSGGILVTVSGNGFEAGATLSIGGTLAAGLTVTPTQITATSPAGSPGLKDIVIANPGGQVVVAANAFELIQVPTPIVTSLSRDVGSTAGGTVLRVNGSSFVSGAVVSFGGIKATTRFVSGIVLEATAPPRGTGQAVVTVSQGGLTSNTSANFEYLPAPTITFASSDFESGAMAPFNSEIYGAGETVTVSTDRAFSGTHAVRCTAPIAGHQAEISHTFADNRMLLEANGVYTRFYIYVPDATVNSAQGGQIKLHLVRSKNVAPAWLMVGVGTQFSGQHPRALVTMIDNGTVHIPGTFWSAANLGDATGWVEVQHWYTRKNGTGRARVWHNGKLFADVVDNRLGGDVSTSSQSVRLGIVYQQGLVGSSVVYLDKVAIANGFIDP